MKKSAKQRLLDAVSEPPLYSTNKTVPGKPPLVEEIAASTSGSKLADAFHSDSDIRRVLDAIDAVRVHVKNIPMLVDMLPGIVVVGDQSSGKSSILERLSGVNLPRGEGICTRVPLEMQMRKEESFSATMDYVNRDGQEVTKEIKRLQDVGKAIEKATVSIAGEEKGVVDSPIQLRICGPGYQDLTVIDLPGIARVPITGQPENIEDLTLEMIKKHISGESKVILCTLPCSAEFVTSGALKLALEVDKEGSRTLGVVSKIDQASKGIVKRLTGQQASEVKLHHGYYPVRCRSQEETDRGMTLEDIEETERVLFEAHPELAELPKSQCGLAALTRKLVEIQKERIMEQFPKILSTVDECVKDEKEKLAYFDAMVKNADDAFAKAWAAVEKVSISFEEIIKCEVHPRDSSMRLIPRLESLFREYCDRMQVTVQRLCCNSVLERVKELNGCYRSATLPNFPSHTVFMLIMSEYVFDDMRSPALKLAHDVTHVATDILINLVNEKMKPYPRLAAYVRTMVQDFLQVRSKALEPHIKLLIESHKQVSSTTPLYTETIDELKMAKFNKPGFTKNFQANGVEDKWLRSVAQKPSQDPNEVQVYELLVSILAYSINIKNAFVELLPRVTKTSIVQSVIQEDEWPVNDETNRCLKDELMRAFDKDREALFNLMCEPDAVDSKQACEDKLQKLNAAKDELRSVIDSKYILPCEQHDNPKSVKAFLASYLDANMLKGVLPASSRALETLWGRS